MSLPDFFALDIGNHSIKVAQLKRFGKDKAKLSHIGKVDTPFGLLDNESDEGLVQLAEKVKQAKELAGIKTKMCVAAVPEASVFSRLITIPKVEKDKIEEAVHWEIKSMIPVPLENVDIAFLDIAEKEVAGQKLVDMYVVAAPKALTDRFRKIAEKAGLELIALETEALANTRAVLFNNNTLTGDVVSIDFGGHDTTITLSRNGVVVFSQTSSTGSDSFTKVIASDYGIDEAEAEKYKRTFGIDPNQGEGKIAKSIEPIIQILLSDLVRALNYFKEKVGGKLVNPIFLTGDGANLTGLPKYLQDNLGIEVRVLEPLSYVDIEDSAKSEVDNYRKPGMTVSIGLGLKDENN